MDVYEAISARKTIRDFEQREIAMDVVRRLLDAGLRAPSHNHLREWQFVILQDKSKRRELLEQVITPRGREEAVDIVESWAMTDELQREMYIDAIPKQFSMLLNAGCLILPCFRQKTPLLQPETLSSLNAFASIWCCIENILIAAAAESIFGVTRIPSEAERETIKRFLNVPEDHEIPCWLALGYPKGTAARTRQIQVLVGERMHINAY
jgi:nitroreductase